MLTAALGTFAALVFGAADFLGGLSSRRTHPVLVTAIVALTGLVLLLLFLPFVPGRWSPEALLWGGLSGVAGCLAIGLLYACLAIGPMSILSPLTAVISALVPLGFGLARGEKLGSLGLVGLGLALVAVVLVGFVPEKGAVRPTLPGVLMAVGSGAMIGAFLVLIDLAPDDSGLVPLLMNRGVNGLIMLVVTGILVLRFRPTGRKLGTGGVRLAMLGGTVDAVANSLLLLGVRIGDLSVIGVLTALYPAGTILLAATVLKERIAPVQWAGLGLALLATALLAL
ncbi:MAG TPA: EamA family transporter [Propionicimonas sp.]|uniref:EamA family transporter n=1 Tax=Propionicimonas sp. TaxID=1955623 RepID=UPI002F3FB3D2